MQDLIEIGKIINTVGLKGEVKIYPYFEYFGELDSIIIKDNNVKIERSRLQKGVYIVKLEGVNDIDTAESLKGTLVYGVKSELEKKLPKGIYFIKDILGFDVISDEGQNIGKLDEVFNTGANDVYRIGKNYIPATKEVIKKVDLENKQIIVHLLKGMID